MPGALLHCPVRGTLNVPERAADELTFTEEKRRIDCINLLLSKGYPREHIQVETTLLRFGSGGRNSFRTDVAVFDQPASAIDDDRDESLRHIVLIAEIKRDNTNVREAVETQVRPALGFLPFVHAMGIYWDDVEKRLFHREERNGLLEVLESPMATLPRWGDAYEYRPLRATDLETTNLRQLFERIENRLHSDISSKQRRFEIMLQLLLTKLYDEYVHPTAGNEEMDIQDCTESPLGDAMVKAHLDGILARALEFYQPYLPAEVPTRFNCQSSTLRSVTGLLAPKRILDTKREIVQDFYMYFASEVYRWDMGQYFTPTEVVDFMVEVVNPHAGEHVKDPACGSGDFLISAFQFAEREHNANLKDSVWGADNSSEAVQISILNMVLNGDGKGQIREEDSLLTVSDHANRFGVLLCNPPFGRKIIEERPEVLRQFDLGHHWKKGKDGDLVKTDKVLKKQQVGLLFAELCVRQATAGGRVGIILPNGYLGNQSHQFVVFREWLIRHARVAAVVAFPRFTFKKSGADVSASALFLEKRPTPLAHSKYATTHPWYAGIVEAVGWSVSDKSAKRVYKRDPETGAYLTDENNEPIPDTDFARIIAEMKGQRMLSSFSWLPGQDAHTAPSLWSVDFGDVLARPDRSLDPKRWSERYHNVRESIRAVDHFRLGDVVEVIAQAGRPSDDSRVFEYVQIDDIADGLAAPRSLRGWELPSRARHQAEVGDIFLGSVWSSVSKWFIAGAENLVVSNGLVRVRVKPEHKDRLVDIVAGLVSENYFIQARALCTGSDGLAELSEQDICDILLPKIVDPRARSEMTDIVEAIISSRATVKSVVANLQEQGSVYPDPTNIRRSRWVQV